MAQSILALLITYSLLFTSFEGSIYKSYNYSVIADSSVAAWKGYSPRISHQGSFVVTGQGIAVVDGNITGGTFIIPITSIKNFDLPKAIKPVLLNHLKSEDFFNMALYPEANFSITNVSPLTSSVAGAIAGANALVTGDFTMIGNTHSVSFPAKIDFNGDNLTVEAAFKLDRTKWGMNHAADPSLGKRHILPEVDIHLKVYGKKISE
jgi:hypothetical protein